MHHRRRSSKTILLPRISTNTVGNSPLYVNAQSTYARRMTVHLAETTPDTTYLYGYGLLYGTCIVFTVFLYSMVASKYMPDTNIKVNWLNIFELLSHSHFMYRF
jgi:hypothetical protein